MWPHDAMVGGAHRTKIGLILQFLERAALQVGPDIKDPGNAATGQNLNAMLIEGSCLNDGIHNIPLRYRNGSILNTGSPAAASFQSASRSSRCISIHAWTSFIFAGGNPPPRQRHRRSPPPQHIRRIPRECEVCCASYCHRSIEGSRCHKTWISSANSFLLQGTRARTARGYHLAVTSLIVRACRTGVDAPNRIDAHRASVEVAYVRWTMRPVV